MKKKLVYPENLSEITLGMYQDYRSKDLTVMNEKELHYHICKTLCWGDTGTLDHMGASEIKAIAMHLIRLLRSEQKEVIYRFTINEVDYALNPRLSEIKGSEYFSIMQYVDNGQDDNLHNILAILYRPIVKNQDDRYEISNDIFSEERAELFKDKMTLDIVYSSLLFFSAITVSYSIDSNGYLSQYQEEEVTQS